MQTNRLSSLRRGNIHQRKCEVALVEACQLGDCENARKLLEKGVSANSVGTFGWTALQEAANGGNAAVVSLLCSYGCEMNLLGTAGETALHKCAVNNDVKTMDVLLLSGCDVDVKNSGGHSALHVAAYHDNVEAARLLLSYNADVRLRDRWNQTPLHRAAGELAMSKFALTVQSTHHIPHLLPNRTGLRNCVCYDWSVQHHYTGTAEPRGGWGGFSSPTFSEKIKTY